MTETQKAYIAVIIQMISIGLSFMFVKFALEVERNIVDLLAHRFTFAFIAASIPVALGMVKLSMTPRGLRVLIPLSLLYPLLFFTFQTLGLAHTSTSEAGIIFASTPVLVAIFASIILKERVTFWQGFFIGLSVCGVVYIIIMKGQGAFTFNIKGIIYTLLSALSTAIYTVLVRRYRQEFTNYTLMYFMMLIGIIVFNIIALSTHISQDSWTTFFAPLFSIQYLIAIFYLGVLSTFMTQFLSIYALARVEAAKVGVFNNLSVIVAVAAGVIFLKETLHLYHLIGALVILIGIIGSNYFARKA